MLRHRAIQVMLGAFGLLAVGCSSAPATSARSPSTSPAGTAEIVRSDPESPLVLPPAGLVWDSGRHRGRNDRQMGQPPPIAGYSTAVIDQRQQLQINGRRPWENTRITFRSRRAQPNGRFRR